MARVKVTTKATGGKNFWKKVGDISTFDVAFSEGSSVRNRRVTGGYTFKTIGNKLVDEARDRITKADKVDTWLMWSSVRHIWKIDSFNSMSFSLVMGAQGGESQSIATAYQRTSFGSNTKKINYLSEKGISNRAKQLNVYAAIWENEYGFIRKTVKQNKKYIETLYLEAYEEAVLNRAEGII